MLQLKRFCLTLWQMRRFEEDLLTKIPAVNEQYKWEGKTEKLFGRFSQYKRIVDTTVPQLQRRGAK